MLWDDHEVQDNYAGGEPDGGLPPELRYSNARKRAAYKAFFESIPYSPPVGDRIYRTLSFGRTVDLIVMDQRQYRANQPCDDAIAPACAELGQPRAFLGAPQMGFVQNALRTSKAAWKVIANEVMIMPVKLPNDVFAQFDSVAGLPRRARAAARLHPGQRHQGRRLRHRRHPHVHRRRRAHGRRAGPSVAVEFVGGSITSRGIGEGEAGLLPGNDRNPRLARASSPPARREPVDRPGRPRPPRLRARDRDAAALRLRVRPHADDQAPLAARSSRRPGSATRWPAGRSRSRASTARPRRRRRCRAVRVAIVVRATTSRRLEGGAMNLEGIHHITAITGDAPRNVDFYTRVLGLRLAAKTVNQDDPSVYHLFYADELGRAGSDITFFEYPGSPRGRTGPGMVHTIVWRVGEPGRDRLLGAAPRRRGHRDRARRRRPALRGPRGPRPRARRQHVRATSRCRPSTPRSRPSTRCRASTRSAPTASTRTRRRAVLERLLGASRPATTPGSCAASAAAAATASTPRPDQRGLQGAGTVHHVAFGTTVAEHPEWFERIRQAGVQSSPIIDRHYFHSIYFREPGGVLFEIADDGPGFTVDVPLEELGLEGDPAAEARAAPRADRGGPHAAARPAGRLGRTTGSGRVARC